LHCQELNEPPSQLDSFPYIGTLSSSFVPSFKPRGSLTVIWDLGFSCQSLWRLLFSEMWCHITHKNATIVSEKTTAFIFRAEEYTMAMFYHTTLHHNPQDSNHYVNLFLRCQFFHDMTWENRSRNIMGLNSFQRYDPWAVEVRRMVANGCGM
jgi:hypothetical protein